MTARSSDKGVIPFRALPGGRSASQAEVTVALVIGGSLLGLWALRRGLKGIGPIELTGSGISGAEFLFYLMVVGGMVRTAQTAWPDNPIVKATAFIY